MNSSTRTLRSLIFSYKVLRVFPIKDKENVSTKENFFMANRAGYLLFRSTKNISFSKRKPYQVICFRLAEMLWTLANHRSETGRWINLTVIKIKYKTLNAVVEENVTCFGVNVLIKRISEMPLKITEKCVWLGAAIGAC